MKNLYKIVGLIIIILLSLWIGNDQSITIEEGMSGNNELDNINALSDIFSKLKDQMVTLKTLDPSYPGASNLTMNGNITIIQNLQSILPIIHNNENEIANLSKTGYFPSKTLSGLSNTAPDASGISHDITTMSEADALNAVSGVIAYHQKYISDLLNSSYSSIAAANNEKTQKLISIG